MKSYGATGDGVTNDAAALREANNANSDFIYLPPGIYKIGGHVRLDKPIVAGVNTQLSIVEGRVLSISAQPIRGPIKDQPLFSGQGRVKFDLDVSTGRPIEIYPEWFKDVGQSDSEGLQKAADSCRQGCTIMLNRHFWLDEEWVLNGRTGVSSTKAQVLARGAQNTKGSAVSLRPGIYQQPILINTVRDFVTGPALRVPPGVSNADVQFAYIGFCDSGVLFEAGTGQTGGGVTVSHVSVTQHLQNTVLFSATGPRAAFRNVQVRANFILSGGRLQTNKESAGVAFAGEVPMLSNVGVIFQAVDPAQFDVLSRFNCLENRATGPISNLVFRVDTWTGGFEPPARLVTGEFLNSQILLTLAGGTNPNYYFGNQLATNGDTVMNTASVNSAGEEFLLSTSANIKDFAVGHATMEGQPLVSIVNYFRVEVSKDWPSGEERTYYLFTVYAPFSDQLGVFSLVPHRKEAWNPGIVIKRVASIEPTGVAITLVNLAPDTIDTDWFGALRFGFQVGPL